MLLERLFLDELTVDFIFTFKLDNDDPKDHHVTQINFYSTPRKVCRLRLAISMMALESLAESFCCF